MIFSDIIVAPATPSGGAIAVVRIEGKGAIELCEHFVRPSHTNNSLGQMKGYTACHCIISNQQGQVVDDVITTIFRAPNSYTGGDMVEIACHGSALIVGEIVRLAVENGARTATAGEFTKRAFLAGKIDLSQAEAVADVIAADSKAALAMADTQLRGEYSSRLGSLREELLHLAALLELELDFGEEEVEFADRQQLCTLLDKVEKEIDRLCGSFAVGNAIKKGIPVAIVGAPNVGKSTLLNRLVGDERALVSEIAGTTRDTIEESVTIDGVIFRFIDTAGVHETGDRLENMGIERTHKAISQAAIIVELFDRECSEDIVPIDGVQQVIRVVNKIDLLGAGYDLPNGWLGISAKENRGIELLLSCLRGCIDTGEIMRGDAVVSNSRHYEALVLARESLVRARGCLVSGQSTDLVANDIRLVLDYIGTITGEVTNQDILTHIFSKFCIGK